MRKVPASWRLPIAYTINPCRGCSHACAYCLDGHTPILMADGQTRPLAELRAGDCVYGTVPAGSHRRYAITTVLDHWSTVKRAYAVTLDDGTRLIASADHRFLTDRGWKYVTGAGQGAQARRHLTGQDQLMGTGAAEFAADGAAVRSDARLRARSIEPLGLDLPMFDITTGTGDFIASGVVSHNCFARQSTSPWARTWTAASGPRAGAG